MRILEYYFLNTVLISVILSAITAAQVNWSIYTEGGLFNSISDISVHSHDLLFRADGNLDYLYSQKDFSAALKLKVRPEIYNSDDNFKLLKFKALGNYSQTSENISWGINITGQKNFYQNNIAEFNHSIFSLTLNSDWYEIENYPIAMEFGYSYQTASENIEQNLDLLFLQANILKSLFPNNGFHLGFYVERFTIDNKYLGRLTNSANQNKGWRYGPKIGFEYFEHGVVSLDYRFLFHSSQVTKDPSYEHWFRFVAGTLFSESWSIFFLVDYYDRQFTLKQEYLNQEFLVYNFLDVENKVNFKLARELSESIEVYIKTGYFKERFFNYSFNFEGWVFLMGIEISN